MILIIDNYDSFVHNLARYVREGGRDVVVLRNDAMSIDELLALPIDGVIISPGPKAPPQAGISLSLLRRLSKRVPLLGVCLGHQCLVEVSGGRTMQAKQPLHGEASPIFHDGAGVFEGIENPMLAGRYHSLVSELPMQSPLEICATSAHGEVMAVRHMSAPWHGVQFHPESLLTPSGRRLIGNFLNMVGAGATE